MRIVNQSGLNNQQKRKIFDLWNNEYPVQLVYKSMNDFETYLNKLIAATHYLLVEEDEEIKGWTATFIRDDEKWFVLIIAKALQGKGFGTKMLTKLKEKEDILNGWVIDHSSAKKSNGDIYLSPLGFYKKNEFTVMHEKRLGLPNLSAVKIKWIKYFFGSNDLVMK